MNIIYATDDNYAYLAGVSMESLFINNRSTEVIDVYILDDGISDTNKNKLNIIAQNYNRKVLFIDVKTISESIKKVTSVGFSYEGKNSFTAYSRLFMDVVLPESVKRALYIDCDTLILSSLESAYNTKMSDDCVISMVVDCTQREYIKSLDMNQDSSYYNSGIILFDIDRWRSSKCGHLLIDHLQNVRSKYPLPDQDLLNVVLGDKISKLPLKYNVQSPNFMYKTYSSICSAYGLDEKHYYSKEDWSDAMSNPVIIHFSGSSFIRPWYFNSNHPVKKLYLSYYKKNIFYTEDSYTNRLFNATISIKIRYLMYLLLPPFINGIVSGRILKRWIQKQYIGENALWYQKVK
ncbi:Lipopolysaccharide biosynthesis protein, LPS:glycosyltransferase [Butyrivibrio fibrisolvens DSM 3071]|uniref:Lipopolysaccharide biosynthesis protein, LPS:glycosyltransferase n=1 Tax=Butyrivibrio fibrisolvens DSM 3071 TaxID=1121131 RepID=A0A1M6ETK7_BUTFI|nr:glycosyltransferase family 8 protein [Butyrivibrio fibrisolvens]SHI88831.1 Lipopolysaccharide biosynthesis protein, LPS:glycosyltransferase [Butyrivibrio fibrisolvens DSM 3071]